MGEKNFPLASGADYAKGFVPIDSAGNERGGPVLSTVVFTLDTLIYASGDVLADTQVLSNAFRVADGTGLLQSVRLVDKDDLGMAMFLVLLSANVALGAENGAPAITDANADSILGILPILTTDWVDVGGARVATFRSLSLAVQAATGTKDLYVALLNSTGTPTFTANGITGRFGILT